MHKAASFLLLALTIQLEAQTPKTRNAAEIFHDLQKLNTLGRVLYIAAHPDDENTRLLSYLANERKVRTAYLSLTRGDGGQNLVGKEQGDLLGIIRTQELLAARRSDGAEQFFTRARDFGYSKTPEETLGIWNKDSVLSDVVWTIRQFRPDVIICRFPTTGEGGHGHHTASALLAVEAFEAAADPKRFSWQLKWVETWQARRVYWNTFNFGGNNTTSPDQLKIDVGGFNPLLGKSYGEIASESRSMHKSQGFGSPRQRGESLEYFKLIKGSPVDGDLLQGVDLSWVPFDKTGEIQKHLNEILSTYSSLAPEKSITRLTGLIGHIKKLPEKGEAGYWKKIKLQEAESILLSCAGLWAEAFTAERSTIPGSELTYSVQVISRLAPGIRLNSVKFISGRDTVLNSELKPNSLFTIPCKDRLPLLPYTQPFWLRQEPLPGLFTISEPKDRHLAVKHEGPFVTIELEINREKCVIERMVQFKHTDPVKGELYNQTEVMPELTVFFEKPLYIFERSQKKTVTLVMRADKDKLQGTIGLDIPKGWKADQLSFSYKLDKKGDEARFETTLENTGEVATGVIKVKGPAFCTRRISYEHIPEQVTLVPAEARLTSLHVDLGQRNIAYVPGAGDDVAECLQNLGYSVTIIEPADLATAELSGFKAVITGIRAFNTNESLYTLRPKLMAYVAEGGNLIVQYNTNSRVGPLQGQIGPYPFTISRDRVTEEDAEVRIINDKHSVVTFPNRISAADFSNWVQERGIYFATGYPKEFQTVFSMNDKKDKEMEGSLIVAPYQKGNFVYTGLAFFRQLPAGVPGAYRLMANLINLPANEVSGGNK